MKQLLIGCMQILYSYKKKLATTIFGLDIRIAFLLKKNTLATY
jgi:hypothetical protein